MKNIKETLWNEENMNLCRDKKFSMKPRILNFFPCHSGRSKEDEAQRNLSVKEFSHPPSKSEGCYYEYSAL